MNRQSFCSLIFLIALLVLMTASSWADLLQEVADGGVIDWGRMIIRCTGTGGAESHSDVDSIAARDKDEVLEAARRNALEKIMTTLKAMVIASDETVADLIAVSYTHLTLPTN